MKIAKRHYWCAVAIAILLFALPARLSSQQSRAAAVRIERMISAAW